MLTIAVSSRALFNVEDGHAIFLSQGQEAFDRYMEEKVSVPMRPGPAFETISRLLKLNSRIKDPNNQISVVMLSRNSANGGFRILNSIYHYGLDIERAVFCSGTNRFRYAAAFQADLFLSTNAEDVAVAIKNGIAAATLLPRDCDTSDDSEEVRIAFDGDSVVFSDESDKQYQEKGLLHFRDYELQNANVPLQAGPFKNFVQKLHAIKNGWEPKEDCPLKTALLTARGAPAHHRVFTTLKNWGIHMDEVIFAGGYSKGPIARAFGAHIMFDDTVKNTTNVEEFGIVAGHVPFGSGQGIVRE